MDSFNKVLSFVLGLIVVIVFIVVLSNRLNLGNKLLPFRQSSPTPTPKTVAKGTTPTPTVGFFQPTTQPQAKGGQQAGQQPTQQPAQGQKGTVKSIPATGSPTEALLILNSALLLGFYLRRKTS